MAEAGYTVFNIDRIGMGQSSHPPSPLVNVQTNAFETHQLVQALRAGTIGDRKFSKVVLAAHSQGSVTGWVEAARYQDIDGLIVTGLLHKLNLGGVPNYNALLWPAGLNPRMHDRDPGYITTRPGSRGGPFFYNKGHFDPGVVTVDEKFAKDSLTVPELAGFPPSLVDGTTTKIRAKTLIVTGSQDNLFCGQAGSNCANSTTLRKQEKPFYPKADLSTFSLSDSGHAINLHRNAKDWFRAAESWLSNF